MECQCIIKMACLVSSSDTVPHHVFPCPLSQFETLCTNFARVQLMIPQKTPTSSHPTCNIIPIPTPRPAKVQVDQILMVLDQCTTATSRHHIRLRKVSHSSPTSRHEDSLMVAQCTITSCSRRHLNHNIIPRQWLHHHRYLNDLERLLDVSCPVRRAPFVRRARVPCPNCHTPIISK